MASLGSTADGEIYRNQCLDHSVITCNYLAGTRPAFLRPMVVRDWSLITGRGGGGYKTEWGACEVLPL